MGFWDKVEIRRPRDCWRWQGNITSSGYGTTSHRLVTAHRVAALIAHGPAPDGQVTRHLCGKKVCCNPRHLKYGTYRENNRDRRKHGTAYKLTWADVEQIRWLREKGWSLKRIAGRFGCSWQYAGKIARGETRTEEDATMKSLTEITYLPKYYTTQKKTYKSQPTYSRPKKPGPWIRKRVILRYGDQALAGVVQGLLKNYYRPTQLFWLHHGLPTVLTTDLEVPRFTWLINQDADTVFHYCVDRSGYAPGNDPFRRAARGVRGDLLVDGKAPNQVMLQALDMVRFSVARAYIYHLDQLDTDPAREAAAQLQLHYYDQDKILLSLVFDDSETPF